VTFQKSFFAKYAPLFLLILSSLIFLGLVFTLQCLVAILAVLILFLMWRFTLHTPYLLRIDGDRLLTQSFRKKRDLRAREIKDISMGATYHYKRPSHRRRYIHMELLDGTCFHLAGFAGGDEMVFGALKNWWSAHQNV
jgi:hypothetical protein